jgi:hypothetical protein
MDMEWELRCRLIDIFLSTFVHSRHDWPLTGGKRCSDEDMIGRTYILYRTFCIYHFFTHTQSIYIISHSNSSIFAAAPVIFYLWLRVPSQLPRWPKERLDLE